METGKRMRRVNIAHLLLVPNLRCRRGVFSSSFGLLIFFPSLIDVYHFLLSSLIEPSVTFLFILFYLLFFLNIFIRDSSERVRQEKTRKMVTRELQKIDPLWWWPAVTLAPYPLKTMNRKHYLNNPPPKFSHFI